MCGAKAMPTDFSYFYHYVKNNQSIKPTVEQSTYIFHDLFISRDSHLLTLHPS